METRRRSIYKALSWRVIATVVTTTLAYLWSQDLTVAASIGAADSIIKLFAYYLHERAWVGITPGSVVTAPTPTPTPSGAKTC
jgi:adenylylsulfate kinase